MATNPWWLPFAKLGEASGAFIKVLAGAAIVVPIPPVQLAAEALEAAEPEITAEADKGVAEAEGK